MTRMLTLALAISAAFPTLGNARIGDVICDSRAQMRTKLTDHWGAEQQGAGLRDPETVLEVWVIEKTRDWIIVQSYTNGTSCIVAMGENWEGGQSGPA